MKTLTADSFTTRHGIRDLATELTRAEERVRRSLARQVHDTTLQQLALVKLLLEKEEFEQRGISDGLSRATELVELSITQLRTGVYQLGSPHLTKSGLTGAIEQTGILIGQHWGLDVKCRTRGDVRELPEDVATVLYRGTCELITNAAKYAGASECRVTMIYRERDVLASVADSGCGFQNALAQDQREPPFSGFGLTHLRSRVEALGGRLTVDSEIGRGATVTISIPSASRRSKRER